MAFPAHRHRIGPVRFSFEAFWRGLSHVALQSDSQSYKFPVGTCFLSSSHSSAYSSPAKARRACFSEVWAFIFLNYFPLEFHKNRLLQR